MYDRTAVDTLATSDDVQSLNLSDKSLTTEAVMLMGYQRTKNISPNARKAWEAGDPAPLKAEAKDRRHEIVNGTLLEIYNEYIPLRDALKARKIKPKKVIDIGCGQAVNDLFLHRDFKPRFTLVDIESTEGQYHFWAQEGAGYASLADAKALLHDNGVAATKVKTINPTKDPKAMESLSGDLVTSLYSCGFHYPIDDYAALMHQTVADGGCVCLDLRKRYFNRKPEPLARLFDAGKVEILYEDIRSNRVLISKEG